MNPSEELKSLYKQMESELHHLNQTEKQAIKRYMLWAFDRGGSAAIRKR